MSVSVAVGLCPLQSVEIFYGGLTFNRIFYLQITFFTFIGKGDGFSGPFFYVFIVCVCVMQKVEWERNSSSQFPLR